MQECVLHVSVSRWAGLVLRWVNVSADTPNGCGESNHFSHYFKNVHIMYRFSVISSIHCPNLLFKCFLNIDLISSEGILTLAAACNQGAVLVFWEDPFCGGSFGSPRPAWAPSGLFISTLIWVQTQFCIRTMILVSKRRPCDYDFISFSQLLVQRSRSSIHSLASQQALLPGFTG